MLKSTIDVVRMLGIAEHRLTYAFRTGKLAEPKNRVGGKRVFTREDIERVAEYFDIELGGGQDD